MGLIGFGQGMYGGGRRWIGECRVGVAGRKDTGGDVTVGGGAQPLGWAGGRDIAQVGYNDPLSEYINNDKSNFIKMYTISIYLIYIYIN